MQKKLSWIALFAFVVTGCFAAPSTAPAATPADFVVVEGTPVNDPMAIIQMFAEQTAAALTTVADPYSAPVVDATQSPASVSSDAKILYVVFSDGRKVAYSPSELATLPQTTLNVRGQDATGASLLAILEQSGWGAYDVSAVSIQGFGSFTIAKDKIGNDFILIFTGFSIRFISPSIPESAWIDGVTVIEAY